jgi:hypothetical protein
LRLRERNRVRRRKRILQGFIERLFLVHALASFAIGIILTSCVSALSRHFSSSRPPENGGRLQNRFLRLSGQQAVFRFGCEPIEITPAFAEAVIEFTQI